MYVCIPFLAAISAYEVTLSSSLNCDYILDCDYVMLSEQPLASQKGVGKELLGMRCANLRVKRSRVHVNTAHAHIAGHNRSPSLQRTLPLATPRPTAARLLLGQRRLSRAHSRRSRPCPSRARVARTCTVSAAPNSRQRGASARCLRMAPNAPWCSTQGQQQQQSPPAAPAALRQAHAQASHQPIKQGQVDGGRALPPPCPCTASLNTRHPHPAPRQPASTRSFKVAARPRPPPPPPPALPTPRPPPPAQPPAHP